MAEAIGYTKIEVPPDVQSSLTLGIIAVRNPLDVAASWQKFVLSAELEGSMDLIPTNLVRWQYITLLILQHTDHTSNKLFVSYEETVQGPLTQAKRLSAFLDGQSRWVPRHASVERMAGIVTPELWHNHNPIRFSENHQATIEQRALYRHLQLRLDDSGTQFDRAAFPMLPKWRSFLKEQDARRESIVSRLGG